MTIKYITIRRFIVNAVDRRNNERTSFNIYAPESSGIDSDAAELMVRDHIEYLGYSSESIHVDPAFPNGIVFDIGAEYENASLKKFGWPED